MDAPVVIEGGDTDEMWRPENDSKRFYGPTRLRDALARSRNLVSIRILRALGVDYAIDYATRFGFAAGDLPRNLTLALGTAQLTPLQLTAGFAVFANGGLRVAPYLIERVEDPNGATLFAATPRLACRECGLPLEVPIPVLAVRGPSLDGSAGVRADASASGRADPGAATANPAGALAGVGGVPAQSAPALSTAPLSFGPIAAGVTTLAEVGGGQPRRDSDRLAPRAITAANAWLMTDLMRDVIRRGTARRALALKRDDIAGKTGTSNDRRDTWFAGFNADLVAGAWVGFDQERSLGSGEEGGHTALPMWMYFMGEALAGRPEHRLPQPDGIVGARISPLTGELAAANDPDAIFELFLAGKLPGGGGVATGGASAPAARGTPSSDESIF